MHAWAGDGFDRAGRSRRASLKSALQCESRRLFRPRGQLARPAGDHESAAALVVQRAQLFAWWTVPGCEDLHDEEVVAGHQPSIDLPALQVGAALRDAWRPDTGARFGG